MSGIGRLSLFNSMTDLPENTSCDSSWQMWPIKAVDSFNRTGKLENFSRTLFERRLTSIVLGHSWHSSLTETPGGFAGHFFLIDIPPRPLLGLASGSTVPRARLLLLLDDVPA